MNQIKLILVLLFSSEIISFNPKNLIPKKTINKDHEKKANIKQKQEANQKSHSKEVIDDIKKECGTFETSICNQANMNNLLMKENIREAIFKILTIRNVDHEDKFIETKEFLALTKHFDKIGQENALNKFKNCKKRGNNLNLEEFKKCHIQELNINDSGKISQGQNQIYENLHELSNGLDTCQTSLTVANLNKLLKGENILKRAFDMIDRGLICKGSAENVSEKTGDNFLSEGEFQDFIKLAAVQNLYFANQDKNQNGTLDESKLPEQFKEILKTKTIAKVEFRDQIKKPENAIVLFKLADKDKNNQLSQEEIKEQLNLNQPIRNK